MEGAVCDSQEGPHIMPLRVLPVTLEQGLRSDEISLLQEVVGVRKFQLFLLSLLSSCGHGLFLSYNSRSWSQHLFYSLNLNYKRIAAEVVD